MSNRISFPNFSGQPGMRFETMIIDENAVTGTPGSPNTDGLDARGGFLATIQLNAPGVYQVFFDNTYQDIPAVIPVIQSPTSRLINVVPTTTGFTFTTQDPAAVAKGDCVISFFLCLYTSNQIFA